MKKSILIVDDEPVIVMFVTARLRANGYEVITASGGFEALDLVRRYKPNLILLDIMMPNMNGYEFLAALKKIPRTKSVPIIMFTAKVQKEDIDRAMALGAQDCVIKPFTPEELLSKIQNALVTMA